MSQPRHIEQAFWRHPQLPHIELRSTQHSDRAYKLHSHPSLSIGAIVSGTTLVTCQNKEYTLQPGQLIFIGPDELHSCNPVVGQSRSYHMLYLEKAWCLQQLAQLYAQPIQQLHYQPVIVADPRLFARYLSFVAMLQQPEQPCSIAEATSFLLTLLDHGHHTAPEPPAENEAVRYLRQRLLQDLSSKPSLQALADELHLSKETLIRWFKKAVGISPMAFADNARITLAKALLRDGMPITDVAQATGFSDQSHFHKAFTAYTTATPGQYQQARSIFDNIR